MKIIGHTSGSYIVEISDWELSKIVGKQVPSRSGYNPHSPLTQGTVLEIYESWSKLEAIIGSEEEMKKRAQSLRGLADVLDGTSDLVKRAIEFVPPPTPQP